MGIDGASYTTLAIDASGTPVVGYYLRDDSTCCLNYQLSVFHCGNAICSSGTTKSASSTVSIGSHTSLALDASGNPVVAYRDNAGTEVELMHCNDPNCLGGDEAVNVVDTNDGSFISLVLDSSDNPVISYYYGSTGDLVVVHCNDPDCSGGDESVTSPDTLGNVGRYTSLALDSSGYPVISYYDFTNGDLKLLRCNDPNCSGGGDSASTVDNGGDLVTDVGYYTSLELDANGYPVISYLDGTNADLKIAHCNDLQCSGGDESITRPDVIGSVGHHSSLELDSSGNPVVSYFDATNEDLKLLHCIDPNCTDPKPSGFAVNVTNVFQDPLPKTCFDIVDIGQQTAFSICDNDFQGAPTSHPACDDGVDQICNDEDPAKGNVTVTVVPAVYEVLVDTVPLNMTADTSTGVCSGGPTCTLTFTNTSGARPWYPWDVAGAGGSWPPDGVVDLANDILGVIQHYCPVLTDPCAKP